MAQVKFKRGHSNAIAQVGIQDGQILLDVDNGELYTDFGENNRIRITDTTKADKIDTYTKSEIDAKIEEIDERSDVVDVVGTYADLEAYDTSKLTNEDIIKVLQDNTHNNAITYYKWVIDTTTHIGAWEYVGQSGPYYTKSEVDTELTSKVDKLQRGNLLVGINNTIDIKGYKMLSITPNIPSESDASKYLQLDIEVNDKDLEEKAASNYAVNDLVVIVAATHWVDAYAIYALSTNENGNSVISVRPYSVISNKFTDAVVDNITIVSDTSDTENWIYVDGKSFGTPVLRTQGSTLTGEQNSLVGRYAFGSGRQTKVIDDGGVAFGRGNTVGYLSLASGRSNKIYNGFGFGHNNIIEWGNNSQSFIFGNDNKISRLANGNFVSGIQNKLSNGKYNAIFGGNNTVTGIGIYNLLLGQYNLLQDGNYSGAIGTSNKIYSGDRNFAIGHDNHLGGNSNLCIGKGNDLFDTASNNILVGQNLSGKYPYQAIFGKLNQDDSNAVAVFAYPSEDKPNYRRNVATVDKSGNIKTLGDVTSNGVNITQQSNQSTNLLYAVLRNVGESATITTVAKANVRAGYSVVEGVEYISVAGSSSCRIGYVSVSEGDVIFIQSLNTLYGNTWTPPSVGWYLTDSCDGLTNSGVTNIKVIQKDGKSHGAGWITYSNVAIVVPTGANYLVFHYKNDITPQIKILKTTLGDNIVKKTDEIIINTGDSAV